MFDPICMALCSGSSGGSGVSLPYLELSLANFEGADESSGILFLDQATSAKLTEFAKSKLPLVLNANLGTGTTESTFIAGWNRGDGGVYTYRFSEVTSEGIGIIALDGPHPVYDGKWVFQIYALT